MTNDFTSVLSVIYFFVEVSLTDHMTEIIDDQLLEEVDDFEVMKESTVTGWQPGVGALHAKGWAVLLHMPIPEWEDEHERDSCSSSQREVAMKLQVNRKSYVDEALEVACWTSANYMNLSECHTVNKHTSTSDYIATK